MNKPFFSIIIPTYNRAEVLYFALKSYLQQDFVDFEIVISDNCSTDNTREVVDKFNDKRIKYFKNASNVGFINNVIQGVLKAKGDYIITHGDDDVILYKDSLKKVYSLIVKKGVGFVRINCLSQSRTSSKITHVWIDKKKDWHIKPNSDSLDIISFFDKVNLPFISGLVFKNENITSNDFAYLDYLSEHILTKGEFKKYRSEYSETIRKASIFLLPTIKYFTNNKNLIKYKTALSQFDKNITANFSFMFFYYLSLALPKSIISIIRNNIHYFRRDTALILSDIAGKGEINAIENSYQKIMNSKINL
ncbi:MAG: glycosyltransferase family 2 protein [Candidatus Roizmanbacteria bacterium]|nr:glycosyltransferase family 2 protein [Candidatus Roizmanbacteria bacterium]